jgi:hypothetical protein
VHYYRDEGRGSWAIEVLWEVGMSEARINFMKQQGFDDASARTCDFQYPALMFQPRVIAVLVLAGVLLQSAPLFLTLSALLWWSTLIPRLNPIETLYNRLVAGPGPEVREVQLPIRHTLNCQLGNA